MTKKISLKIIGMHCTSCVINIDGELEDTDGVIEASTSYARQETEVTFDPQKTGEQEIKKIIAQLGYETQTV